MAFVSGFEVVDERMLTIYETDITLKCLKLKWHPMPSRAGQLTSASEFAHISLDHKRGYAHLVRGDSVNVILNSSRSRIAEAMNLFEEKDGWPSHLYYVNRFCNMILYNKVSSDIF